MISTRSSRTNTQKKDVFFIIGDWHAKVGSQEIPEVTDKFDLEEKKRRAKANRILPRDALVMANTLFQQHKRRLYTWTSPDGQLQNQIDYILCNQRWRSSIQSAKQDQVLTAAQVMNSLFQNSDVN